MNIFSKSILSAGMLIYATVTFAAPVQLQFTGAQSYEYYGSFQNPTAAPNILFANGTVINEIFFYDSATPATATNISSSGFGLGSIYPGAITNAVGSVAGNQFGAATGFGEVFNSNPGDPANTHDLILLGAGDTNQTGQSYGSGLQGFSVGDYTLVGSSIIVLGDSSLLSSQSLPTNVSSGVQFIGAALVFKNSNNEYLTAVFPEIAPVPVPASISLLSSGLVMLVGITRKPKAI